MFCLGGKIKADIQKELEETEEKARGINERLQVRSNTGSPCMVSPALPTPLAEETPSRMRKSDAPRPNFCQSHLKAPQMRNKQVDHLGPPTVSTMNLRKLTSLGSQSPTALDPVV